MKQSLLYKIKDKLIDICFFIFIITGYSIIGVTITVVVVYFWLFIYELLKLIIDFIKNYK